MDNLANVMNTMHCIRIQGLATFVATLADEKLGVAIAIAIALHNIPEGEPFLIVIQGKTETLIAALVSLY